MQQKTDITQKITPFLWFDKEAEAAMNFYVSAFKDAKAGEISRYGEIGPGENGSVMSASFALKGLEFIALNAGPHFKITPAVSFFVHCDSPEEVEELYAKLSKGGKIFMPLDKYPFSEKYSWIEDQYGVSWQLNLSKGGTGQKIVPFLWFGDQAEAAMNYYTSVFSGAGETPSEIKQIMRFGANDNGPEGQVKFASFSLGGEEFIAMDANKDAFTPAVSLFVKCQTQEEVDYYWDKLSEGGAVEAQQCGWLADKFGLSWQIVPVVLWELIRDSDKQKAGNVMAEMMKMKKMDIAKLKAAYNQ